MEKMIRKAMASVTALTMMTASASDAKAQELRIDAVTAPAARIAPIITVSSERPYGPEPFGSETANVKAPKSEQTSESNEESEKSEKKKKESKLEPLKGVHYGPSGKETWYDLDMSGCIYLMNHLGYSSEDYPYWVREDGCKMFGDYIMVAADLNIRPKGTILECSLGTAIVVDTGDLDPYQLDIAVDWDSRI